MDWRSVVGKDGQMLKRIVMVLFSLAALADDVGARSGLRRFYVLWLLRRAEAVTCAFAVKTCAVSPLDDPEFYAPRWSAAPEAARLAASFRALALVLYSFACHVQRVARWHIERQFSSGRKHSANPNAQRLRRATHQLPYADTS